MKRVLLSTVGTVAGLVALLSFKTHGQPIATAGALPSAGVPDSATSSSTPSTGTTPSTSTTTAPSKSTSKSTKSTASSTPAATSKTYLGSAITTRYGIVQVKVTVSGSTIKNVSFAQLTAFDGRSQEINSQAAPILLQE